MEEYAKSFCYTATGVAIISLTVLQWVQYINDRRLDLQYLQYEQQFTEQDPLKHAVEESDICNNSDKQ